MTAIVAEVVLGYVLGWLGAMWVYGERCSLGDAIIGRKAGRREGG